MKDIDGNVYRTVVIGNFVWMAENLKTSTYSNGTKIPLVTGNAEWSASDSGSFCWYDDNKGNSEKWGALYNWFAVSTGRLCPDGWRVPSDSEWKNLEGTVDSLFHAGDIEWDKQGLRGSDAGKRLKAASGWRLQGTGTDNFNFCAQPGGERLTSFNNTGGSSDFWWSCSAAGDSGAWYRCIIYSLDEISRDIHPKKMGFSVRCVRNK